jgi:hypothetical protein
VTAQDSGEMKGTGGSYASLPISKASPIGAMVTVRVLSALIAATLSQLSFIVVIFVRTC